MRSFAPRFSRSRVKRAAVGILLIAACLGMARLQLWRAETRGANYAQQQDAQNSVPIQLSIKHRNANELLWRPVNARGTWLSEQTIFLDNKILRQRPGLHVLTPLKLEGSEAIVLVNRGWVPSPRLRTDIPLITTPAGTIELRGRAAPYETRYFELAASAPVGPIWQHVREEDYRQLSGLDALPVIVLQTDPSADQLVRDWDAISGPENPAKRHYGYAAMWLVFALIAAGYSFIIWTRR